MSDNRKHVLIAVPTVNNQVTDGLAALFAAAHERNRFDTGWKFSTTSMNGLKGYARARNGIAQFFLEGPCDYLWMFDQDMVPPDNVFDLLETDADILAPVLPTLRLEIDHTKDVFGFSLPICACRYKDLDDMSTREGVDISEGDILDVDGVGFGSVLIKRKVLEDKRIWLDPTYTRLDGTEKTLEPGDPPPIFRFHTKPNGDCECGEDFGFCWQARKLGYSVKLDTRIFFGHLKFVDLRHLFHIRAYMQAQQDTLREQGKIGI